MERGSLDVTAIERQLDELWAGMTEISDLDQQAVTRAWLPEDRPRVF